ncbi:MAG TPA: hypothetical protein VFX58_05895, partial [Chitinophagaceae bacterium]|nr:hypothetical protein [Chitinophagaceae bacterium]
MRWNKWFVIALCAALTTSCGENSTTESTTSDTTTTYDSTTANVTSPVTTSVEVPEATRTSFQTRYPNATNVTWRRYEPVNSI